MSITYMNEYKKRKYDGDKPKLYINHATGKISGSDKPDKVMWQPTIDADRLERIRNSMRKINDLMTELKKLGDEPKVF